MNLGRNDRTAPLSAWEFALPFGAVGFVALVCLAFIGLELANILDQRRRDLDEAFRGVGNLAQSMAQHAEDTFRAADIAIVGVAQRVQMEGTGPDTVNPLRRIMAARLSMLPALADTIIVDATGGCVASGRPILAGDCDFAENFAYHRGRPDPDPYLGSAVYRKGSGTWIIPLSRRFNRDGGGFAGIVVGAVNLQYISGFYDTFKIGENGAIVLTKTDHAQLLRRPLRAGDIGRDLGNSQLFREFLPKAPSGVGELTSVNDGVVRLIGYRTVPSFPLVASVAFAKDEVLREWRQEARSGMLRTLVLVLVIGLLGCWLIVQIRRHQRLEAAHRDTAAAFRLLADNSSDLIVRVGPDMRRVYVSPASRALLGYEPEELLSHRTDDIVHSEDRALWQGVFGEATRGGTEDVQGTYRVLRKDGAIIWVEVKRRRLAGGEGFVVSTRDVTRRKLAEEELEKTNEQLTQIANQDGLTGLATRRRFDEALAFEVRRAKRDGTPLSLVMIDVDRFKLFNDRYGHPAGDGCLRDLAGALKSLPGRPGDLVARYGGEEMVILLPNTPRAGARLLAERARLAVRALAIPHEANDAKIVTISLGVATLAPGQDGQGEALVEAADHALYAAKSGGRDQVREAEDGIVQETAVA